MENNQIQNQFFIAVHTGNLERVENLITMGADVNARALMNNGVTPVFIAAQNGHLDLVERLGALGANVYS